jgi:IclR family pca regulon transcriptional regulator
MADTKAKAIAISKKDLIDGLIKGVDVITAFNEETDRYTASALALRIGLSRTAARRYLITLVHIGLAETDGKSYWLTPKILNLGRSYLESYKLPRKVLPFLQRLTHQLQESTTLSVLDGDEVVYLSRVNAPRLFTGFEPGTRLPAYTATAGRVLLAALPDETFNAWLEKVELIGYTHKTVTNKEQMRHAIMAIRKQGYSMTESEYEIGVRGISVPLKNRHGEVLGALGVSMNIATCTTEEAIAKCVPALQATANHLMMWI